MANALGGLIVNLGLNATEFFQGLTKAEFQAKKFAQSFDRSMSTLKSGLAGLGVGLVVNELFEMGKAVVSSAAALDDLADATGSSVENLSKLDNQARISGTSFEELEGLVLKLAASMGGVDEKSKKVQETLKLLGVTAKDPAEALQQVAVALSKYADGTGKAAAARILFDKTGPKFLATLKDIAELQNVAATTTTKQAEEAEKLEKAFRQLQVEATGFRNVVLSFVVPALNTAIEHFNAARKAGLGFFASLELAGQSKSDISDQVGELTQKLDDARKSFSAAQKNPLRFLPGLTTSEEDVKNLEKRLQVVKDLALANNKLNASRGKDILPPELKIADPGKAGRAVSQKDRISDAQRYLQQLELQLQKTQELSAENTVLADIEAGRLKLSGDVSTAQLLTVARMIDAAKAQEKAQREQQKLAEEEAKARERISAMRTRDLENVQKETESMARQNEQIKEEIEVIGKDEAQIQAIIQARLDHEIAIKKDALAIAQSNDNMKEEAGILEDQIRLLQERKGLLVEKGQREAIAKQQQQAAEEAKRFNDIFVESFADAAASVATHTASIGDAIKAMERTIVDAFTRIAAKKFAEQIFGSMLGGGSGGGNFLGTLMQSLLGGSSGMPAFAGGGNPPVGMPVIVGERGPELFVPKTTGTIVPNSELVSRRASRSINVSVNVLPGASRRTAEQAAMKMVSALRYAENEIG